MGRPPKPWQRKQTGAWYCTLKGKRVFLGHDKKSADKKFHELMVKPADVAGQRMTLYKLSQLYLDWVEANRAPGTYDLNKHHLKSFIGHVGKSLKAAELRGYHVTNWYEQLTVAPTKKEIEQAKSEGRTAKPRRISTTTQSDAAGAVKRMLNWAVERGLIELNPVAGLRRPKRKRRDVCYNEVEWQTILKYATGSFLDFLEFLSLAGCRPQEARMLEGRHVQGDQAVFEIEDSKGQFERRVIFLPREAKELLSRLAIEFPEGPLFRNSQNKPWTKNAIVCRMRRLRTKVAKELGYEVRTIAYGARHSYATRALENGIDSIEVAELMGHRDRTMVARTYSHLLKNPERLLKRAEQAIRRTSDG